MKINFSIITVTYNSKKELIKTINSVQSQTNKNFTHIIKDGLSTDQTNKIDFTKYQNTRFFESKDKGVYDAMNQAFYFSENEFILYLNAGDIFFSNNSLKELSEQIKKKPNFNSYVGGTLQIDQHKMIVKRLIGLGKFYKLLPLSQLPHPSFVIRKSILAKLDVRPFDQNLEIAGDYKQQLLLRKKNLWKTFYLSQIISIMPTGGISNKNHKSILKGYKETFCMANNLFKVASVYIILIKIFLNLYSRINVYKIKHLKFKY